MSLRKQSKAKHNIRKDQPKEIIQEKKKHSKRKGIPEGPVMQTVLAEVANATKLRGIGNVSELQNIVSEKQGNTIEFWKKEDISMY